MSGPEPAEDMVSRAEFEALLERVEALEQQLESEGHPEIDGLDHRDRAVIERMDVGGRYSRRGLVKGYLKYTDITNEKTARNRARQLVRREEFFRDDGNRLVFEGVRDDE